MDTRLFPLSHQFFTNTIEPLISAHFKRPGRPPKGGHYRFFCSVLYTTLEEIISEQVKRTNTYSWSFRESQALSFSDKFTVHVEAKASFLGLVDAKAEATNVFTWDWKKEREQTKSKIETEEKTHKIQKKVKVPPYTSIKASSMINWINDAEIPFTASLEITGRADRATKQGGIVPRVPVSASIVEYLLTQEGYQGQITSRTSKAVFAEIAGILKVDAGFETTFATQPLGSVGQSSSGSSQIYSVTKDDSNNEENTIGARASTSSEIIHPSEDKKKKPVPGDCIIS
ncbi:MAG: hypothetical protein IBJ00_00955 [Alphaproteobacteria bacterium]|nr:hypothetical protein [Alphaproteobacteria bacterium]